VDEIPHWDGKTDKKEGLADIDTNVLVFRCLGPSFWIWFFPFFKRETW